MQLLLRAVVCANIGTAVLATAFRVDAHPIVAGYERFYADDKTDKSVGGRVLLSELNCVACHKATGDALLRASKRAPILDGVAERVQASYLREFIADPQATKAGTTMPNLFQGLSAEEKTQRVEALVHFLVSLTSQELPYAAADIGSRSRGEALYHRVGCAACHDPRKSNMPGLPTSVALGDLSAKYTLPSLARFLHDPLSVRPSGRMPSLNLSTIEARDIAAFLLPDVPEKAGIAYQYYEGNWGSLPNFDELQPKANGAVEKIDAAVGKRGDQFGLRFEGQLQIDVEGGYTFHLGSDDGSRLVVDDKLVVDHDGVHGFAWKSGSQKLGAGTHHVKIDYFEGSGEEQLRVEFEGPDTKRRPLADAIRAAEPEAAAPSIRFEVKPALAAEGRKLFASIGCASCHELHENGNALASQVKAAPLSELRAAEGCLSEAAAQGVPNFSLTAQQRVALAAAIDSDNKAVNTSVKQQIAQTMLQMNCYACHQRDGMGGIEEARNVFFQGTQPEMGDEGRIPPHLSGIGDKLTDTWLAEILAKGAKERPYMHTRMPNFGAENVGHLPAAFAGVDRGKALPEITLDPRAAKKAGWQMVGNKAFNCIGCHTFGRFRATGVQSLDMTILTRRLREDWFRRYVRNPQAYRPGTRMPSSWPEEGESPLKHVLDGDSDKQIHAVWVYLSDGPRARTPSGLVTNTMELIASHEAIIYRNFIAGAGPRAIGVGYPEGVNLAFDADQMRLALIWQGRFIDASRHWSGRGEGFQPPAGEKVRALPDGVPFASLENADVDWPKGPARPLGYKFRGYRLTEDQRPTFLYDFQSSHIEDFPNPTDDRQPALTRAFTIKASKPVDNLWYRAAVAGQIEPLDDGWYQVDDLKMRLQGSGGGSPLIRNRGGSHELIWPVRFEGDTAKVLQTFELQ